MRVISGIAKGRRLRAPAGLRVRPTADRVRQTIFDMLGTTEGDRVLDLFAGSGSLGIEALSRGAAAAVFVESDASAIAAIRSNLESTGLAEAADVVRAPVDRYLGGTVSQGFDLVFLDPPYERGLGFAAGTLTTLAAGGWVAPGGMVVLESAAGPVQIPAGLREVRTKTFGRTQVTMIVNGGSE